MANNTGRPSGAPLRCFIGGVQHESCSFSPIPTELKSFEKCRWGVDEGALLPALRLTREEAMAVFLSARLMARYADEYDPDLGAAFQKLAEALPAVLGRHVERAIDQMARALKSALHPPGPVA